MSTASRFETESGLGEILRGREHTLDRAQDLALQAIEAQIGPEFDAYAAQLESQMQQSALEANQTQVASELATNDIGALRARIGVLTGPASTTEGQQ